MVDIRSRSIVFVLVPILCVGALGGCATGGLAAIGRRSERVVEFEDAYSDGTRLWLVYESETRNADDEFVRRDRRAVSLRIADLDPGLGLPVEEVPFERIAPEKVPRPRLRPLTLTRDAKVVQPAIVIAGPRAAPRGFLLANLDGAAADAAFRSETLFRYRRAPWALALIPPAALWDTAAVPALMLLGIPLFGFTE
jgi:hypothetical protein